MRVLTLAYYPSCCSHCTYAILPFGWKRRGGRGLLAWTCVVLVFFCHVLVSGWVSTSLFVVVRNRCWMDGCLVHRTDTLNGYRKHTFT